MKKKKPTRKRSPIAKDLRTPKYKMQVQKDRKKKVANKETLKALAEAIAAMLEGE